MHQQKGRKIINEILTDTKNYSALTEDNRSSENQNQPQK